ncbi:hypothetical protein ACET3Z_028124 [Daucus carota]
MSTAGFSGEFPSSIANLTRLVYLDFWAKIFSGIISSTHFQNLVNLEFMDLGSNLLSGTIPSSLFALPSIRKLFLSYNSFHGSVPNFTNTNFSQLQTLHKARQIKHDIRLKELKLASCGLQQFPDLRYLPNLITLDLAENQIFGDIPYWIWNAGNGGLQFSNLSVNKLEKLQKPYVIHNVSSIDLRCNHLCGEVPIPLRDTQTLSGTIPVSMCSGTNLKVLDLSNNCLTGNIPSCLFELGENLGVLKLGNNSFTGNLSSIFSNDCGLETLDLHGNLLEGSVPESLANCATLEVLNLGNNRINDKFLRFLKNLQIYDIGSNHFTGNLSQNFPVWKAMRDGRNDVNVLGFKSLRFGGSRKTYQDAVTISIKGQRLDLVKILNIYTSIDISNNRFGRNIPHTISELKSLSSLNMSHNTLSGSIPNSFGTIKVLETLDLLVNKLTGKNPLELGDISFLKVLDLSYNQLSGKIPTGSQIQTFPEASFEEEIAKRKIFVEEYEVNTVEFRERGAKFGKP